MSGGQLFGEPREWNMIMGILELLGDALEGLDALEGRVAQLERGPEPDRSAPINIIPPTIIEGGQEHGRP